MMLSVRDSVENTPANLLVTGTWRNPFILEWYADDRQLVVTLLTSCRPFVCHSKMGNGLVTTLFCVKRINVLLKNFLESKLKFHLSEDE